MNKLKIYEELVDDISIDVSLDDLLTNLLGWKEKYSGTYTALYIQGYDWCDVRYHRLMGERLETDEEFNERVRKQAIETQKSEAEELKLLKRLKEKYETSQPPTLES